MRGGGRGVVPWGPAGAPLVGPGRTPAPTDGSTLVSGGSWSGVSFCALIPGRPGLQRRQPPAVAGASPRRFLQEQNQEAAPSTRTLTQLPPVLLGPRDRPRLFISRDGLQTLNSFFHPFCALWENAGNGVDRVAPSPFCNVRFSSRERAPGRRRAPPGLGPSLFRVRGENAASL